MNAEQVVEKILSQARAEAASIVGEANEKAARQRAQLDQELAAYEKQTEALARAAGEDKLQRMLAASRMRHAKKVLAAKVAILDEVFDRAQETLNKLGDAEYRSLMADLIKKAVETGDEEVIVGKNESRIDNGLIKDINRQLGSGYKGNLRLSSKREDIGGGFLLSRGKVRINAGSDVLIGTVREQMQIELANELFGS